MVYAVIASSNCFQPESVQHSCEMVSAIISARRQSAMDAKAIVVFDALRDSSVPEQYETVRWVCDQIKNCFKMDDCNITPALVHWPPHGRLPQPGKAKTKLMTRALVQEASLVVLCAGSGKALLQSFERRPDIRSDLALHVTTNQIVLLAWSAGAICSGESAEHSPDRNQELRLSTGVSRCIAGLCLIPGHSFAPHFELADCKKWHDWIKSIREINFGMMHFICDRNWIAFKGGQDVSCSSLDTGSVKGVWRYKDQYFYV